MSFVQPSDGRLLQAWRVLRLATEDITLFPDMVEVMQGAARRKYRLGAKSKISQALEFIPSSGNRSGGRPCHLF